MMVEDEMLGDSENEDAYPETVVLDNGSGKIKAGFAGNKTVSAVFRTIIGRLTNSVPRESGEKRPCFVGDSALAQGGLDSLTYPMSHGVVTNWDDMQEVWEYLFMKDLRINPQKYPILLTEAVFNPTDNRERMVEIMFEVFNFPALYVEVPPALSLLNSGRLTGVVCDVGDGVTQVMPVYQGKALLNATRRINVGGRDVTNYLQTLLASGHLEDAHIIKERCCHITPNTKEKLTSYPTSEYTLPSGDVVRLGEERYKAPEALFLPSLLGMTEKGTSELIYESIMSCDAQVQPELFQNIILAGGSAMFRGMSERVHADLSALAPDGTRVKVIAPPERNKSAWMGGSILASLDCFQKMWITKEQFMENGQSVVHKYCKYGESLSRIKDSCS